MPDDREQLAAAQARLVAALTGAAPPPDGFDERGVALTARTLVHKRRAGVAKAWPAIADGLGERFTALFAEYAADMTMPPTGTLADGREFALWLRQRGNLPDAARLPVLLDRARRGWPIRVARAVRRTVIAVRVWGRVYWWRVGFGRSR